MMPRGAWRRPCRISSSGGLERINYSWRSQGGKQVSVETKYVLPPRIGGLIPDGAALAAGMRVGDIVWEIGGRKINSLRDLELAVAELPHKKEITFLIERQGKRQTIAFTPRLVERKHPKTGEVKLIPLMGVQLSTISGIHPELVSIGVGEALERAVIRVWDTIENTVIFIHAMLFKDATTDHLAGPIGIAKYSSKAATSGMVDFIAFIALISTAIGLFNLFPIPVLDGGHLCFYLIEAIRRRPASDFVVRYSTLAGFSLLILLMVFVTFNNDLGLGEWFRQD